MIHVASRDCRVTPDKDPFMPNAKPSAVHQSKTTEKDNVHSSRRAKAKLCSHSRRRLCCARRQRRRNVALAGIALLARHRAAQRVGLAVAVASASASASAVDVDISIDDNCYSAALAARLGRLFRLRRVPARQAPDHAGKALELKALALPLAAWRAGAVERAQAGVDGALVGLGPEFVAGRHELGGIEGFFVTVIITKLALIRSCKP
jgi:hypothetical protein